MPSLTTIDPPPGPAPDAVRRARTAADAERVATSTQRQRAGARVARCTAATLAATLLIGVAPASAKPPAPVMIAFDAISTTGDRHGGQSLGTFTMTGTTADAGTVRIAYHLREQRMRATATFSGARGILTIGLRAELAPFDGHQTAAGRWRTCGGTGEYRRVVGQGTWSAVIDVLNTPTGVTPLALHGAYSGSTRRRPASQRRNAFWSQDSWC